MNTKSVAQRSQNLWLYAASGSSALAGMIHASNLPKHFEVWFGYGVFFLIATVCQVLLALVLLAGHPVHRVVLWSGIFGNAAIILMWVLARTIGNPLSPMAGEIKEIGVLDAISKIAELAVIISLAVLLRENKSQRS